MFFFYSIKIEVLFKTQRFKHDQKLKFSVVILERLVHNRLKIFKKTVYFTFGLLQIVNK